MNAAALSKAKNEIKTHNATQTEGRISIKGRKATTTKATAATKKRIYKKLRCQLNFLLVILFRVEIQAVCLLLTEANTLLRYRFDIYVYNIKTATRKKRNFFPTFRH